MREEMEREDLGLLFSPSPVGQVLLVSIQGEAALSQAPCVSAPESQLFDAWNRSRSSFFFFMLEK